MSTNESSANDVAPQPSKKTRKDRVAGIDRSAVHSAEQLASMMPKAIPGVRAPKSAFVAPAEKPEFLTEKDSPFPDGYSIAGEREALKEVLAQGDELDFSHPLFNRVMELDERERQLARQEAAYHQRNGADESTPFAAARSMQALGSLVAPSGSIDTMTLHTREGLRMFMGRAKDPSRKLQAIPGATRVASAAKIVWMLTSTDNPYADWALLRLETNLADLTDLIQKEIDGCRAKLDAMKERGITYSVLASREPKTLELGFKSPYGFAIAEVVASFDYFVRMVKSLVHRNLLTDEAGMSQIRSMTRVIRGRFNEFARFERTLTRPDCANLSRADYVLVQGDQSTEEAKAAAKRIAAITEILGAVGPEVFSGAVVPKHSKRRQRLTPGERVLLDQIAKELDQDDQADPAAKDAALEAAGSMLLA